MAAIDVPSLDVWDMLYVKLNEAAHVLYQDENGLSSNVPVTWLVIQVKRSTTLQRNHRQLFEERL